MKPRVTISRRPDGEIEIWLNPEGRDRLVKELQMLGKSNDHFHLWTCEVGDIQLSTVAYRPDDEVILEGKVLLRPDDWDRPYFPHVLEDAG